MQSSPSPQQWHNSEGQLHRIGGPAVVWPSGRIEWWTAGKRNPKQPQTPQYLKRKIWTKRQEIKRLERKLEEAWG